MLTPVVVSMQLLNQIQAVYWFPILFNAPTELDFVWFSNFINEAVVEPPSSPQICLFTLYIDLHLWVDTVPTTCTVLVHSTRCITTCI